MWVHSVYFWLKKDLEAKERQRLMTGLHSLRKISSVQALYLGTPAETDRPAVDKTYDVGLTVLFENKLGHQRYQDDPLHQRFLQAFKSHWIKVVIYDHDNDKL